MNIKYPKVLLIIIIYFAFFYSNINAQCLSFVKTTGFSKLDTSKYSPPSRLNAVILTEGDIAFIYKPFFAGKKYKIVIICNNDLPLPSFTVKNFQEKILFDSKESDNTDSWVYKPTKSQNLIISLKIPKRSDGETPKTGCVAVVIGIEKVKNADAKTESDLKTEI